MTLASSHTSSRKRASFPAALPLEATGTTASTHSATVKTKWRERPLRAIGGAQGEIGTNSKQKTSIPGRHQYL